MEHRLQFSRTLLVILLMTMVTVCATKATSIVARKYRKLGPGQNITGLLLAELTTRSKLQCSDRCSKDDECWAYKYAGSGPENCILIHIHSPAEYGQTFVSNGLSMIYKKECSLDCHNEGRCTEVNGTHQCLCSEGYTGINCERDTNECESMPCVHGNCSNNINNYNCQCSLGYNGINCDTDIDECESNPCVYDNCSNSNNSYTCQCLTGYNGTNCETDINECDSSPCVNGTCSDVVNAYRCICSSGYGGTNREVAVCVTSYSWTPLSGWSGPDPVVYRSFDNLDCMTQMEYVNPASWPLISGQSNTAITMNHRRRQWVDLGVLEEACITRPETCGAAGGAIVFWLNKTHGERDAFLSSFSTSLPTSFLVSNDGTGSKLILEIRHLGGFFHEAVAHLPGWTHYVLNYIGPEDGQGIRIYQKGIETGSGMTLGSYTYPAGNGRVVIGKYYTDMNGFRNLEFTIDELLFFNTKLSDEEVEELNDMF